MNSRVIKILKSVFVFIFVSDFSFEALFDDEVSLGCQIEGFVVVVGEIGLIEGAGERFNLLVERGWVEFAIYVAFRGVGTVVGCVVGSGYA